MMESEKFVERLSELLAEAGLNRKQFAEKCGIPYTTVIGWTTLNRLPDYSSLVKIADFFDCAIDYLAGRQDDYELSGDGGAFSARERALIDGYRRLDEDGKELVLRLVEKLGKRE